MIEEQHARVQELIARKDGEGIRRTVERQPPADVADLLLTLDKQERVLFFRALPRSLAGKVFTRLNREEQDGLLEDLTAEDTRELLTNMNPDDRTELLEELPAEVTHRLMDLLSPEDLKEAQRLLDYPSQSVGRRMTPDYVALRPEWTVAQALTHIRTSATCRERVSHVYVMDERGKLLDDLPLEALVLADPEKMVAAIMDASFQKLSPYDDQEEAVRKIKRYDLFALPVLDDDGVLLGTVTADDLFDVAEEETTEDIAKQAGSTITDDEESRSEAVLQSPVTTILRMRLPWLFVALVGGLTAGLVMGQYEETLEAVVALAFFVPLIMDMGGNVGTQASTIFVRGVAVGHIDKGNLRTHLLKELLFGFATGVVIGALAGAAAFLWQGMFELALVVFLSMVAVCTIASLIGYAIPWAAQKLGRDPASVSAPFITTVKDVTALFIYFGLATLLMGALL